MPRILPTLQAMRQLLDDTYYKEYHKESPTYRLFWSDNRQTIPNIEVAPLQITISGRLTLVIPKGIDIPKMVDMDWVEMIIHEPQTLAIHDTLVECNDVQISWKKHLPNSPEGLRESLLDINVNILAYLGHLRGAEMNDSRFCIPLS